MGVDFADSAENADTVDAVNNVVTRGQLGQTVNLLPFLFSAAPALLLGTVGVVAEGDDKELLARQLKARTQRASHDVESALCRLVERIYKLSVITVGNEVVTEVLCRLFGAGKNHAAAVGSEESVQVLAQLLVRARPLGELLCCEGYYLRELQIYAAVHKAL